MICSSDSGNVMREVDDAMLTTENDAVLSFSWHIDVIVRRLGSIVWQAILCKVEMAIQ